MTSLNYFALARTQCPPRVTSHPIQTLLTRQSFLLSSLLQELLTFPAALQTAGEMFTRLTSDQRSHISSIAWCHSVDKSDSQTAFKSFFGSARYRSALRRMESTQVTLACWKNKLAKLPISLLPFICAPEDADKQICIDARGHELARARLLEMSHQHSLHSKHETWSWLKCKTHSMWNILLRFDEAI